MQRYERMRTKISVRWRSLLQRYASVRLLYILKIFLKSAITEPYFQGYLQLFIQSLFCVWRITTAITEASLIHRRSTHLDLALLDHSSREESDFRLGI